MLTSSYSTEVSRSFKDFKLDPVSLYRCLKVLGAILIIVLSSFGALLLGSCKAVQSVMCDIDVATDYADISLCILLVSTAVAAFWSFVALVPCLNTTPPSSLALFGSQLDRGISLHQPHHCGQGVL